MNVLNYLRIKLNQFLGLFPSKLPVGKTEFETWSNSIIKTYKVPMDDRSAKFGLCAMIMRLNPTEAYKSKAFFALCLSKGASAQVASYVMEDIKNQQKAEFEAAQKAEQETKAQDVPVQS